MSITHLRAIALRAQLEAQLARISRRARLHPNAVSDVAGRAVAEGAFTLAQNGILMSASGEDIESWLARVLVDAPFYRESEPGQPIVSRPSYGRVGDGGASRRLELANGETPEDIL